MCFHLGVLLLLQSQTEQHYSLTASSCIIWSNDLGHCLVVGSSQDRKSGCVHFVDLIIFRMRCAFQIGPLDKWMRTLELHVVFSALLFVAWKEISAPASSWHQWTRFLPLEAFPSSLGLCHVLLDLDLSPWLPMVAHPPGSGCVSMVTHGGTSSWIWICLCMVTHGGTLAEAAWSLGKHWDCGKKCTR